MERYVLLYCKIYTDTFNVLDCVCTGDELFEHLMQDSGHAYDEGGNLIAGDKNIWYLGCNEKFGHIQYGNREWKWGMCGSSFDIVEEFVRVVEDDGFITSKQFSKLMTAIEEGRKINNMYKISDYLSDPKCFISDKEDFRIKSAEFFNDVKKGLGEMLGVSVKMRIDKKEG